MGQLLTALGWFLGTFALLAVLAPLILYPIFGYYSEAEPESFTEPEFDAWSIDIALFRRLPNINSLVATVFASALAAFGMATDSPDMFVAGGLFGIVANALIGWRVIANAAPEIANEFGYTLKRR